MLYLDLLVRCMDDRHTGVYQLRRVLRADVDAELLRIDDREEAAAEGDVDLQLTVARYVDLGTFLIKECRNVLEGNALRSSLLYVYVYGDEAGWCFHLDGGHRLLYLDHAGLYQDGVGGDGAVAAHVMKALTMHEDDADICFRHRRLGQNGTEHVLVSTRLQHDGLTKMVIMLDEVLSLLRDGLSHEVRETAHNET